MDIYGVLVDLRAPFLASTLDVECIKALTAYYVRPADWVPAERQFAGWKRIES